MGENALDRKTNSLKINKNQVRDCVDALKYVGKLQEIKRRKKINPKKISLSTEKKHKGQKA